MTFLFNGGPGSGSVWLQMGAFGPKRVAIPVDARDDGAPPYPIVDNPDACSTSPTWSSSIRPAPASRRALGKTDPKEYYGVQQDAQAVAEVIRLWLNDNGRWNSPKYLGGESYGTTRSAAVVNQLARATYNDVSLNGIILISTILDFGGRRRIAGQRDGLHHQPALDGGDRRLSMARRRPATQPSSPRRARQFALGHYASPC